MGSYEGSLDSTFEPLSSGIELHLSALKNRNILREPLLDMGSGQGFLRPPARYITQQLGSQNVNYLL